MKLGLEKLTEFASVLGMDTSGRRMSGKCRARRSVEQRDISFLFFVFFKSFCLPLFTAPVIVAVEEEDVDANEANNENNGSDGNNTPTDDTGSEPVDSSEKKVSCEVLLRKMRKYMRGMTKSPGRISKLENHADRKSLMGFARSVEAFIDSRITRT